MLALNELIHHGRVLMDNVSQVPANWPFLLFLPALAAAYMANREPFRSIIVPRLRPLILIASIITLLAVLRIGASYLATNFILNSYAVLFSTTSWLFCLGQPIYAGMHTPEHYSIPYGPYGYMLVGATQSLLGPSMCSSKLPGFLATFGSLIFLYLALRTRVSWLPAFALAVLAGALQLPLDPIQFWPRPEPFIFFAVSAGLWAATRKSIGGLLALGFLFGFAIDLKIYAFAFFFVAIVVAWTNHKSPVSWMLFGLITLGAIFLPFAWPNISLRNYVEALKIMEAGRRFIDDLAVQNFGWMAMLSFIAISPLLVCRPQQGDWTGLLWKNAALVGAFLLSFLVVSHPASLEGSGPHQLLPFIPVAIFLAAHLYGEVAASFRLVQPLRFSLPGISALLSVVLFLDLYALIEAAEKPSLFRPVDALAKQRITDLRQIYLARMPCVLLNVAGSMRTHEDDFYRVLLVFNGMPVGIEPAATMDYESLGYNEPDLADFIARLKSENPGKPIYWICPKDVSPFSLTSYFGSRPKVFSDKFLDDFHLYFQFAGHTPSFDIYEESDVLPSQK
jgi:hypothetical protein